MPAKLKPTFEQLCIVDAFTTGEAVLITALAGTGKTTSLKMVANATRKRGAYLAYNRAIADEARGGFPTTVDARTAHSFAFQAIGRQYAHRLDSPRLPLFQIAEILRLRGNTSLDGRTLSTSTVARIVQDTVARYCYSADEEVQPWHVPQVKGIDTPQQISALRTKVVPFARAYWEDLTQVEGQFQFTHDNYLKLWGLSHPQLPFDYLLFDEAQDANPVILDIVERQESLQRVVVGDSNQAIYGWRGAIDAMDGFEAEFRLPLTQSFRFGLEIAKAANFFLAKLGEMRVSGTPGITDQVGEVKWPKALLCRTNAGALDTVLSCQEGNVPVALVGGAADVIRFCRAADQLKAGKMTTHEDLCAFRTWLQVQEYVEEETESSDLARLVKLVDRYGTDKIIAGLERTVPENRAQVIVSTAHKAKGREWESVKLHGDFERGEEHEWASEGPAEIRLQYVAATRAKKLLDLGPLTRHFRPSPLLPTRPDDARLATTS